MGACGLEVGNPLFPPSRPPVWTETAFELSCWDMQTISWESYKEGSHALGEAQMMLSIVQQIFQIFITYAESISLSVPCCCQYQWGTDCPSIIHWKEKKKKNTKLICIFKCQENGNKRRLKAQLDHLVAWSPWTSQVTSLCPLQHLCAPSHVGKKEPECILVQRAFVESRDGVRKDSLLQ